jgi:glycosyltransferase involved in cell wall biosynthesis
MNAAAPAPLVSVIMPVHNCGAYIREAIESALAQTHANLEVLVGDNGSTDDSRAIAAAIAQTDPRVRVFSMSPPTHSPSGPRNEAIRRAGGEFLAFLDADDAWGPRHLELHLRALAAVPGVALSFSEYHRFKDSIAEPDPAAQRRHQFFVTPSRYLTLGPTLAEIGAVGRVDSRLVEFIGLQWCPINTSAVLIRRARAGAVSFPENVSINEDLDCWLRTIDAGGAVGVPVVTSYYRVREGSLTGSDTRFMQGMAHGHLRVLRERGHRFSLATRWRYRHKIASYFTSLSYLQAEKRQWGEAFRNSVRAAWVYPAPRTVVRSAILLASCLFSSSPSEP